MHAPAVPQGTEMIYIQWEVTMNIQEMHEAKRTTVEQVIEHMMLLTHKLPRMEA